MSVSKKIQGYINGFPERLRLFKNVYAEKSAIKKKSIFYNTVKWDFEQTVEFKKYWKENYGIEISDKWHRLYEAMNGVYCKEYLPEMLYATELERHINDFQMGEFINNKAMIAHTFSEIDSIVLPLTYIVCCNNSVCDGNNNIIGFEKACKLLENAGDCVIKPTVVTGSGHGVEILKLENGIDIKTGRTVSAVLKSAGKDYIVQDRIKQSKEFSDIYPSSLNTIRYITYLVGNEVHSAPTSMRIGTGGSEVDNIHAGGLCIGVNRDGTLKKEAYYLGYGDKLVKYTEHPDTKIKFEGYLIGDFSKLEKAAIELHSRVPQLGMISWDLTFDENENVVLIEANCNCQSVWFPQIINGEPLFGDDTPYMLKKIYGNRKI